MLITWEDIGRPFIRIERLITHYAIYVHISLIHFLILNYLVITIFKIYQYLCLKGELGGLYPNLSSLLAVL